jgi:hypothetical protein
MLVYQNWLFHVLIPWLWTLRTALIPKGGLVQFLILTTEHWYFSRCRFSTWTTFASCTDLRHWVFFKIIWDIVHWSIGIKFSYLFESFVLYFSCPNVNNSQPVRPQWTSTYQRTIHWMPLIISQLWMNLNWVNIWFHTYKYGIWEKLIFKLETWSWSFNVQPNMY